MHEYFPSIFSLFPILLIKRFPSGADLTTANTGCQLVPPSFSLAFTGRGGRDLASPDERPRRFAVPPEGVRRGRTGFQ